jgi:hypothetical protein
VESVNFQISAIGAELLPGKRPLWHLGDKARFSQQPVVPNHGLGSSSVAVMHTRPMPHTGTRPGQYSDGEPQRADIGSGRCGMAGVADLGALGGFWKRRPAFAARATHSGTKPALSQARPGPARRCMWAMADCTRHEDFMRVY